jgi:cell wall-associated NlpC family hydrolase
VSTSTSASTLGQKAVYLASLQAGKPYVYGAEGPNYFDCSGLVQYVFKQLGRSLPRTAEEQYEATTRISPYNKQVGDLIFFGTPGNIYHVGIYAGNGEMWAAPHSGATVSRVTIWSTSYSVGRVQ